LDISKENDIMAAQDMFTSLSKLGEFIVADWGWDFIERIDHFDKINCYLQKRFEEFIKM
jgi:hypothetical protein